MHVDRLSFAGNPNVGMYAFATDSFVLLGYSVTQIEADAVSAILQVPVIRANICGTSLIGVFVAGDNDVLFVPDLLFANEEQVLSQLPIKVVKVPTKNTALGNNIIYQKGVLIVPEEFEESAIDAIKSQVPVTKLIRMDVADTTVVGSCVVCSNKGALVHDKMSDAHCEQLKKALQIPVTRGTINYGSSYVRSGIICNSHGFIVGKTSAGTEITNADEALGFITTD